MPSNHRQRFPESLHQPGGSCEGPSFVLPDHVSHAAPITLPTTASCLLRSFLRCCRGSGMQPAAMFASRALTHHHVVGMSLADVPTYLRVRRSVAMSWPMAFMVRHLWQPEAQFPSARDWHSPYATQGLPPYHRST
jgi:hypothetical protein